MKALAEAKMRLADVLDPRERAELALAMLVDVVTACVDSEMFDKVGVVSSDSEVFWQVRELGALPIAEPATLSGLNDGLTFGVRYLARRVGCDEVVIFPADVPLVRPMDVCTVVNALPRRGRAGGAGAGGRQRDERAGAAAAGGRSRCGSGWTAQSAHRSEARRRRGVVELALERLGFDVDADGNGHGHGGSVVYWLSVLLWRTHSEIFFYAAETGPSTALGAHPPRPRWRNLKRPCFLGEVEPQGEAIDYLDDTTLHPAVRDGAGPTRHASSRAMQCVMSGLSRTG